MSTKKRIVAINAVIIFVVLALAVILLFIMPRNVSLINPNTLNLMMKKSDASIDTSHLAPGIIPPTNKWFSGIALQSDPKTIFPTPYAVSLTENSFSYGLPTIVPSGDVITGGMAEKVTFTMSDAVSYQVERYDELSITVSYKDASGARVGSLLIMAGSPYIQFSAYRYTRLTLSSTLGLPSVMTESLSFQSAKGDYVVYTADAALTRQDVTMQKGGLLSAFVAPDTKSRDVLSRYALNKLHGAKVSYEKTSDDYKTVFSVNADGDTLFSLLPHQQNNDPSLFSYDTLYGKQRLYAGRDFSFTTPAEKSMDSLPLGNTSTEERSMLLSTLKKDIASTKYAAKDSYYAGKELYRNAQLLELAHQIGDKDSQSDAASLLKAELGKWLSLQKDKTEKYFYYDESMRSIVGAMPSFGSENGNDHHFHYGYFIYAAAVMAKYDESFLKLFSDKVDLLVADIANYDEGETLPLRRNFDPYFGHSWASGDAAFNDGNNQESSSEAINAWIATKLWADATSNQKLAEQSEWMLSNESSATRFYWMDVDPSQKPYAGIYTHSLVSLNWGGKREYGTFFSGEPAAKLGIQLIPFSPTQAAISAENRNATKHIAEATKNGYSQPFGDYMLMYNPSLSSEDKMKIAATLPDTVIDGANSRTYLYALIMSQR